jgi:hypothetical protein
MGTVAKSYMRKGFLIYEEMRKYLTSIRRPLHCKKSRRTFRCPFKECLSDVEKIK